MPNCRVSLLSTNRYKFSQCVWVMQINIIPIKIEAFTNILRHQVDRDQIYRTSTDETPDIPFLFWVQKALHDELAIVLVKVASFQLRPRRITDTISHRYRYAMLAIRRLAASS